LKTPLQRIVTGALFMCGAFVVSGLLEFRLEVNLSIFGTYNFGFKDTLPSPPEDGEGRLAFHNGLPAESRCSMSVTIYGDDVPVTFNQKLFIAGERISAKCFSLSQFLAGESGVFLNEDDEPILPFKISQGENGSLINAEVAFSGCVNSRRQYETLTIQNISVISAEVPKELAKTLVMTFLCRVKQFLSMKVTLDCLQRHLFPLQPIKRADLARECLTSGKFTTYLSFQIVRF